MALGKNLKSSLLSRGPFQSRTPQGLSIGTVRSGLQKACRRGDVDNMLACMIEMVSLWLDSIVSRRTTALLYLKPAQPQHIILPLSNEHIKIAYWKTSACLFVLPQLAFAHLPRPNPGHVTNLCNRLRVILIEDCMAPWGVVRDTLDLIDKMREAGDDLEGQWARAMQVMMRMIFWIVVRGSGCAALDFGTKSLGVLRVIVTVCLALMPASQVAHTMCGLPKGRLESHIRAVFGKGWTSPELREKFAPLYATFPEETQVHPVLYAPLCTLCYTTAVVSVGPWVVSRF
jgi:hypothetical protein